MSRSSADDEIGAAVSGTGAQVPALDRLTQIVNDMTEIEWELLRKNASRNGGGRDPQSE